jgi:hypothetical protein
MFGLSGTLAMRASLLAKYAIAGVQTEAVQLPGNRKVCDKRVRTPVVDNFRSFERENLGCSFRLLLSG